MDIEIDAWTERAKGWAVPPKPRFDRGPWNVKYLPPFSRRTSRVHIEPLAPRIWELDYEAYMSSIDHLVHNFWGGVGLDEEPSDETWWIGSEPWPNPNITRDAAHLDMMGEWTSFGRGERFSFAALTHDRTKELGCTYLWQIEGEDPYEASLRLWVIESELATDLERHLLEEMLAWVEQEWEFNRIILNVPRIYQRGLELAVAVGLQEVTRKATPMGGQPRPDDASFQWERP